MNRKCIKVAKTNNYKALCIRHTVVKWENNFNDITKILAQMVINVIKIKDA